MVSYKAAKTEIGTGEWAIAVKDLTWPLLFLNVEDLGTFY